MNMLALLVCHNDLSKVELLTARNLLLYYNNMFSTHDGDIGMV